MEITPQQANIIVLDVAIKMLERQNLNSDKLTAKEQEILGKAKDGLLSRLRENLRYAQKQSR